VQDILHSNTKHAIKIDCDFDCEIYGDKDRIGQVIINFVTNAIKYSPTNNNIELRVHEVEKNQVAVSVKDFGIGISSEDQQKIFERFYRVQGKNENIFAGFGIGLFIAAEIIKRHDGYITVESENMKGSTFTFVLPYEAEKEME